ncbi:MAG: BPSS1780 family membrane protein [Gammaproteobacteria bacterium]
MEPKVVGAAEGWHWYVCGWGLFVKNPGVMIGQFVVLLLIAVILNFVPLIGSLALALITPVLAGGWFYSIRRLDEDATITIGDIFEGFRNEAWTRPLLILGIMILVAEVLVGVIVVGLLGITFLTDVAALESGLANLSLGFGGLLSLALMLLLLVVLLTALFFAIPLLLFRQIAPIAALQDSLIASFQHWLPLFVFGLVYLVAAFFAAIPLGLGFLVLMPVSVCAAFCSYKAIYE